MRNKTKKIIKLVFFILLCLLLLSFYIVGLHFPVKEKLHAVHDYLVYYVSHYYVASVLTFFGIFFVATFFSIPVTILLTSAAGHFFGIFAGSLYSILAAVSASILLFYVTRFLMRDTVQHSLGNRLQKFNDQFKRFGHWYIIFLQLLPITPMTLVTMMAALSPISGMLFARSIALGLIPGTLIYAWLGSVVDNYKLSLALQWVVALVFLLAAGAMLLLFLVKKDKRFFKKK